MVACSKSAETDWTKDREGNGYLSKIDSLRPEGRGIFGDAKAELGDRYEQPIKEEGDG